MTPAELTALGVRKFPDEWSCTAWEDCHHDGICHDPKNCGAIGPRHDAFYGLTDEDVVLTTGENDD